MPVPDQIPSVTGVSQCFFEFTVRKIEYVFNQVKANLLKGLAFLFSLSLCIILQQH